MQTQDPTEVLSAASRQNPEVDLDLLKNPSPSEAACGSNAEAGVIYVCLLVSGRSINHTREVRGSSARRQRSQPLKTISGIRIDSSISEVEFGQ